MNETKNKGVKMTNSVEVKAHDIFVQPTGYSIHRNKFYQVFEVSKSGKTVKVAKIESRNVTSEGFGNGTEVPKEMAWVPKVNWIQARVIEIDEPVWDKNGNLEIVKQPALKFPYQENTAKVWDNEPVSYSHMD